MNRYPLWKYVVMVAALAFGLLYTLPNFFGESPAVQVSSGKQTVKVDEGLRGQVEDTLKKGGVPYTGVSLDPIGVKVRFADTDTQLKARDLLVKQLNPDPQDESYVVALNLLPSSPAWLTAINARPMYLGLDLRGGVHFLLQVDMHAALTKKLDSVAAELRGSLRDKNIRHSGISRERDSVLIRFRDAATREQARGVVADTQADLDLTTSESDGEFRLIQAVRAKRHSGYGDQAEYPHPAQPRQRTGRGRAHRAAAGTRPHRGRTAGRAGPGARAHHHRPHRDPAGAAGR
jgi:preprotein translocase subunit SecD